MQESTVPKPRMINGEQFLPEKHFISDLERISKIINQVIDMAQWSQLKPISFKYGYTAQSIIKSGRNQTILHVKKT